MSQWEAAEDYEKVLVGRACIAPWMVIVSGVVRSIAIIVAPD